MEREPTYDGGSSGRKGQSIEGIEVGAGRRGPERQIGGREKGGGAMGEGRLKKGDEIEWGLSKKLTTYLGTLSMYAS